MPIIRSLKFHLFKCDFCGKKEFTAPYSDVKIKNWKIYAKKAEYIICFDCLAKRCVECGGLVAFNDPHVEKIKTTCSTW